MKRWILILGLMVLTGCGSSVDQDMLDASETRASGFKAYTQLSTPAASDSLVIQDASDTTDGTDGTTKYVLYSDLVGGSVEDAAYSSDWNGDTDGTSKNALWDYLSIFDADGDGDLTDETWSPSGSGDVTGVLGDATGDVPVLYQTATAFTANDTTPDVSTATIFKTANTSATTITDFDGSPVDGQLLWVRVEDANTTVDFTSSGLKGHYDVDWTAADGDWLSCIYDGTDWLCKVSEDKSVSFSSLALPGDANPTTDAEGEIDIDTDDSFIEFYDTASRVVGALYCETFAILEPDQAQGVTDDVILKHFMADAYPHGVTLVSIAISTSANVTDTFLIEEWSNRAGSSQSTIESIALSATNYQEDDGTLSDSALAADSFLNVNLDGSSDNVAQCEITITYWINPGD